MLRKKISLIGVGNIGGTLAYLTAIKQLGDLVLLDTNEGIAKAKALDISQACFLFESDVSVLGTSNYENIINSDVIVITAGVTRTPNISRDILVETNAKIISYIGKQIKKYAPNAFVICVTNPLDAMVYVLQQKSGLPFNKIAGMGGTLDSSRLAYFLAEETTVSIKEIDALVLGSHGDTMVPILEHTKVQGVSVNDLISLGKIDRNKITEIIQKTRNGGSQIVNLLKTGSAFYAPAIATITIAESYLLDLKKILPCCVYDQGKYNLNDICIGLPAIIGKNGIEDIIKIDFDSETQSMFEKSIKATQNLISITKNYLI